LAEKLQKNYFGTMKGNSFFVHPSSIIDEGAQIGTGTTIWHFCHLMPTCIIGDNCNLGQNVYIDNKVVIGNGVKIQNNVSVYNGVIVEDDVFLGPSMVFTNVLNPRSFIERKTEFKKTLIKKGASIGANATLLCGIEVGRYAMIGAGAVITKSVTDHALMLGNPGRQAGWVSEEGITLDFDTNNLAKCTATNKVVINLWE
jgi:UDP-2-acetamido-3-amino-2,3-dideoxy-glucuronate N-acetyltransferase